MSNLRQKQKQKTLEDLNKIIVQQPTTSSSCQGEQPPSTPERPQQRTTLQRPQQTFTQNISSSSEDDECSNDAKTKTTGKKPMYINRFRPPVSAVSHQNSFTNYSTSSSDGDDYLPTSSAKLPRLAVPNEYVVERNRKGYPVTADKVPRKCHNLHPDKCDMCESLRQENQRLREKIQELNQKIEMQCEYEFKSVALLLQCLHLYIHVY